MAARPRKTLERWEVAVVKAMIATGRYTDQDVQAYFTRPTRSINARAIHDIRTGIKFRAFRPSSPEELERFLREWPDVDPETGLSRRGDELLVKAREAMIAAVHVFNGAGLTFRAEIFITTASIAWTYLMHAWFKREGIDYRYFRGGAVVKTAKGADRHWDLARCLSDTRSPLSSGAKDNLEFLLEIRHEIEHRSTDRIDDALGAKLQACCINFNEAIVALFGARYGLERRLPLALQFVTFDVGQREAVKAGRSLPANVETAMDDFHARLTPEQQADPAFAYRVAFVPKVGSNASRSDAAIEFVKPGSEEAKEISRVLLKEVDRPRHRAAQVVKMMQDEGFTEFRQREHTLLWQKLDAKDPAKGFGRPGDYVGTWVWFDAWVERVRTYCEENRTVFTGG